MKKSVSTKVISPQEAYAAYRKIRKKIKRLRRRKDKKRQALRLALAEVAVFARKLKRSPLHQQYFDQYASMHRFPKTRSDGSPHLRLIKYFGLYTAASTGKRFADVIEQCLRLKLSPDEIRGRLEDEGPKALMAKAKRR